MNKKSKVTPYRESPEFVKAMEEYEKRFNRHYPIAIGYGYPGRTDEENIAIIRECLAKNEPLEFNPPYRSGRLY